MARGLGFAIPAQTVSWVVAMLLKEGHIERPRVGVAARGVELPPRRVGELGQARAVELLEVVTGEPAEHAGLRAGDLVLSANGEATGSVDDLVRKLVLTRGEDLTLVVARGRERLTFSVSPRGERRAA
jgi:serine protease Do